MKKNGAIKKRRWYAKEMEDLPSLNLNTGFVFENKNGLSSNIQVGSIVLVNGKKMIAACHPGYIGITHLTSCSGHMIISPGMIVHTHE